MKKTLLTASILAANIAAFGQANFWNLNGSFMDCNTGGAGTLSSTSYPQYLYEADASSFALPGLCSTYCNFIAAPAGGRVGTYKINHITEGVSASISGFSTGTYALSYGSTTYLDASGIAAGKLQNDGSRVIYGWQSNALLKVATISPTGAVTNTPTVLYTTPGAWAPNFDRYTEMEVSSDGNYLILGGADAKSVVLFNLATNTPTVFNAPGGIHSRIQGYEYVKSPSWASGTPRIYISYNEKNAANPSGTGGIGYFNISNPSSFNSITSFPSGTSATGFGFTEIELAKNGQLYMAYNSALTYNFTGNGTVYGLSSSGTWTTSSFTVPASNNVYYSGAHCNKYYIQKQIDGENYDAGNYIAPNVVANTTKLKAVLGSTTPNFSATPTIYRCGDEPLVFESSFANLVKGYSVKVTTGTISATDVFTPAGGGDNVTHTCPSYDPSYYANSINFALLPYSFVPIGWVGSDWKVEITVNGACGTSSTSTTYYKVRSASALAEYKKPSALSSGTATFPFQTTLPITTAAPVANSNITVFRGNINAAQGWMGANTCGMGNVNTNGAWSANVYEVDPSSGARMVRSSIPSPIVVSATGSGPTTSTVIRFRDFGVGVDPLNPPYYTDASTTFGDGPYFALLYEHARTGGDPSFTLADYSNRVYCIEFTVTEPTSGCVTVNKSYFKIARNGTFANGFNAKLAPSEEIVAEEELTKVEIYPNPVSSNFTIKLPYSAKPISMLLMDNSGRRVMENNALHTGKNEINIEHLTNGVYFYEININGEIQHGKLLKQ